MWRQRAEHRFARRRLSAYVDGELSPATQRRVLRHADECPECGPMLRALTQIRSSLRSIGGQRPGDQSVVPLVLDSLRREQGSASGSKDTDLRW